MYKRQAKYISAPGQFINIKINDSLQPYLRRPMSISDYDDNHITIVFKVVGEGTEILKNKEIGSMPVSYTHLIHNLNN